MFLQRYVVIYFSWCQIWDFAISDTTCKDHEIHLKNIEQYQASVSSTYQSARAGYEINRTSYGISVSFDPPTYVNQTNWRQLLDNGNLKEIAYTSLEFLLTEEDTLKHPELLMVPTMAGALTIVYNLPNITKLNLTLDAIVNIYLGKITRWNASALQYTNPDVQLPDKQIYVTGNKFDYWPDTYLMTAILSAYSDEFRQTYGIVYDIWPNESNISFSTSSDIIKVVNKTAYSIGYSTLANTNFYRYVGTSVASIRNNLSGTNVKPTDSRVITSSVYRMFNESNQTIKQEINLPTLMNIPYPFIYFHYIVINRTTSPDVSCCAMQETSGFLEYFMDVTVKNNDATWKNGYVPLPKIVSDYVKESIIPLITCNDTVTITEFRKYTSNNYSVQLDKSPRMALIIGLSLLAVVIALISLFVWYNRRVQLAKDAAWFVESNELILQEDRQRAKLFCSVHSINTIYSENASDTMSRYGNVNFTKYYLIRAHWKRNDTGVLLKKLNLKHVSNWNRKTKVLVASFVKDIAHPNICAVHGVTTLDKQAHLITQHCIKGTLNYVLATCRYQLSRDIMCSLAQDVLSGLKYLHQKNIVHGNLSSITCYVDGVWNVKLTDWAIFSISSSENIKPSKIKIDDLEDDECLINLLYLDAEMLSENVPSAVHDLYSYGMLLVEIFTRKVPFSEEVELCANTYPDIIKNKFNKIPTVPVMNPNEVPQEIQSLVKKLTGPIDSRPNLRSMTQQLHQIRGSINKSIVDIMMETMEKYVEDLEEKVIERTSELTDVTNQMKDLLFELLPSQIATKFIKREPIEPEFFECVTIFFSDVVGFTTISSRSTPYQVMNFLNELWKLFDKVMEKFDVYKVDTIGDAYMVASGLPKRNGINHCKHICDLALMLRQKSQDFYVPHLPDEKVQIRMGINSGPVTAGIIGHKMPQYCIFGDTVNTASRMESTSLPLKIHVSQYSMNLTLKYFPHYVFAFRGDTDVKGKGVMKTFWLLGTND